MLPTICINASRKYEAFASTRHALRALEIKKGRQMGSDIDNTSDVLERFLDRLSQRNETFRVNIAAARRFFWIGAKSFFVIFVMALLVVGSLIGYQSLDKAGWLVHNHDTPVWIQGDWLVGEYRDCQMRTPTVPAQKKELDSLDSLPRLLCGEDANGLFNFQRETALVPVPPNIQAPPLGLMYLFGVTASELDNKFHTLPARCYFTIPK